MKWTYVIGVVVLTALLSIGGTFLIMEKKYGKEVSKVAENEKEKHVSNEGTDLSWVDAVHTKMIDEWKSGDRTISESLVQEVMQKMIHQKVVPDVKEGSILATPERIDILTQIIEENIDTEFEHDETYSEILKRWKKGDFSTVGDDYNTLKRIQGEKIYFVTAGIASDEKEETKVNNPKLWKDVSTPEGFNNYGIEPTLEAWIAYHAEDIVKTTDVNEYYTKASQFASEMKYFQIQGGDLEKDIDNLHVVRAWMGNLEYVLSRQDTLESDRIRFNDDLKQTFKYYTELLHDLDVVINHDGKGETFGVTRQLDGNKVKELESYFFGNGNPYQNNEY